MIALLFVVDVFISIAGTVFANKLRSNLAVYAPDLDPVIATAVRQTLSVLDKLDADTRARVVLAYVHALGMSSISDPFFGGLIL